MKSTLFIGGGNMAYAIIGGLLKTGVQPTALHVIEPNPDAAAKIEALGVPCSDAWPNAFQAEQVLLAVKPQVMQAVLAQYAQHLQQALLISIAAGVSVNQLRTWSQQPNTPVARCMPNTPALVGQGLTGLFFTDNCSEDHKQSVETLFNSCGTTLTVKTEDDINAITAISGSGPGYVFFLMEALATAAKQLGFSEEEANTLVNQTFLGAATLAQHSKEPFSVLREKVTSKGGTTFAGLEQLRNQNVHLAIVQAAQAAEQRAKALQG